MSEGQRVVSIPFPRSDIDTLAADGALHQHASHSRVSIWSLRGSEAEIPPTKHSSVLRRQPGVP